MARYAWLGAGVAALLIAAPGSAAAAGVYLNDPTLAKSVDAVDASLQGADTLKPYADQLATLRGFGTQEDAVVAAFNVAKRDYDLTSFVGLDDAAGLTALDHSACARLELLIGKGYCTQASSAQLVKAQLAVVQLSIDSIVAAQTAEQLAGLEISDRDAYERRVPAAERAKDDCASLEASPPPVAAPEELRSLALDCVQADHWLSNSKPALSSDGLVAQAWQAGHAAVVKATEPADKTALDSALKKEIDAANALAKSGAAEQWAAFQRNVEGILGDSSAAAKALALKHLDGEINSLLVGSQCDSAAAPAGGAQPAAPAGAAAGPAGAALAPPVADPAPATGGAASAAKAPATAASPAVDCSALTAGSTGAKAAAVWSVLQVLAKSQDVNSPAYRSANWLAAAKGVVAVWQTQASLQAASDKAAADVALGQFDARAAEASLLARLHLLATKPDALPKLDQCGVTTSDCALALYVDSWNMGRIPAAVLDYRDIQLLRSGGVQEWQAAASEERALMLAGSSSLKDYADGGLQAQTIARFLVGIGLITATAAK